MGEAHGSSAGGGIRRELLRRGARPAVGLCSAAGSGQEAQAEVEFVVRVQRQGPEEEFVVKMFFFLFGCA